MTTTTATGTPPLATTARPPWAGLIAALGGLLLISVDVAVVNVAAPTLQRDLAVSGTALVLVVSGYTAAYAMLLITGARLGDDYGHRRLFLAGLGGFTLASLVCGVAPNGPTLIVARLIQGAAGAMMGPQVLSVIQSQFSGEDRRRAVPLYATVLAVGTVVGQIAGGLLVSANVFGTGWRPAFLLNVPLGALVFGFTWRHLPPSRGLRRRRLDVSGVLLVSSGVLALVAPMVFGPGSGWPAWTYASLVAGCLALMTAARHFRRMARAGLDPLVDVAVFKVPGVRRGLSSLLAIQIAYGGFLFAYSVHLQDGLRFSPLRSGLTFAPFAASFALTSLGQRHGAATVRRWLTPAALATLAVGYAAAALVGRNGSWAQLTGAAALVLAGGGFGAAFSATVATTVAATPGGAGADASGLVSSVVQLGFVGGVATLGTFFLQHRSGPSPASAHAFASVALAASVLALAAILPMRNVEVGGSRPLTSTDRPTEPGQKEFAPDG